MTPERVRDWAFQVITGSLGQTRRQSQHGLYVDPSKYPSEFTHELNITIGSDLEQLLIEATQCGLSSNLY